MSEIRTLGDLLTTLAGRGDAPALIAHQKDGADVWSAGRLAEASYAFARALRQAGVREQEPVGILAPNRPEWLAAFLGVVAARGLAMPLSDQITRDELDRFLEHSGARRLITVAKHLPRLKELPRAGDMQIVLLDTPRDEAHAPLTVHLWSEMQQSEPAELPAASPDEPAALLFTSGTTGTPKGVSLTHANLTSNIRALLEEQIATKADRALLPLPFHHTYPLTVGLLAPLAIGATIVIPAGLTGPQIAGALNGAHCTIMIAVPRLYEALLDGLQRRLKGRIGIALWTFRGLLGLSRLLRERFGSRAGAVLLAPLRRRLGAHLRLMVSGGARLDPEIAATLEAMGFDVLTGYGLTETAPILTFNPPSKPRLGTAGRPVPGVELDFDRSAGAGDQDGEVLARGPNVFSGYWKNEEATRESFTEEGFFKTGDLGYLDEEGYLHLVGRSKELIVLGGGKNVVPEELESVYGQSGLIEEIAVLEHGNHLVGLIVPNREATQSIGADQLEGRLRREIEQASARLAGYQRLADVAVWRASLPRTPIGKLRRHELPELFDKAKSGATAKEPSEWTASDRALLETPPNDRIWPWLEQRFPDHQLSPDTSTSLDLGLDSFDWMTMTMELEQRFGIQIGEERIAQIATLRDFLNETAQAEASAGEPGEGAEPSEEDKRWLEPTGSFLTALGQVVFWLNRQAMRRLFRLEVEGLERLPAEGPLLITPNHTSYLDPFVVAACFPLDELQRTYWAGTTSILFRGPLTRLFSRTAHVLPVDPGHSGVGSALGLGRIVLRRGERLVWFPEGQRSRSQELLPFMPGIAWLIEEAEVASVPVWIDGAFEAWPPQRRWPRLRPIRVHFGEPVAPDALHVEADPEQRFAKQAATLRDAVAALAETR